MLDNEDPSSPIEHPGTTTNVGNTMTEVRDFEYEDDNPGTSYPKHIPDGSPDRPPRSPKSREDDRRQSDGALEAPVFGAGGSASEGSEHPKDSSSDPFGSDKCDQSTEQLEPQSKARPIPKVRFRSRVRITSGMRRHRQADTLPSTSSSVSGSPSSSISAPLRSYNSGSSKGWGPLGQRVSFFAWQNRDPEPSPSQGTKERRRRSRLHNRIQPSDEGTSLLASTSHPRYTESEGSAHEDEDAFAEDESATIRAEAIDEAFGLWPGRLFNHRWWWWQLEPVVCCHCIDYSDSED